MPFHVAAGVRYEETEVFSESLVRIGQTISWDSANEFNIGFATEQGFDSGTGKYDYVLPSLDLKLDVKDNLVMRASYSETIGRPGWNDIQGGANLAGQLRFDGGTGSSGDPSLKPLESTNYDLSLEWYYGEGSYASVGYFRKEISNFISISRNRRDAVRNAHACRWRVMERGHSVGGCVVGSADERPCIRDYIFANHPTAPGVTVGCSTRNGKHRWPAE